jgi:hypothetical protein
VGALVEIESVHPLGAAMPTEIALFLEDFAFAAEVVGRAQAG